MSAGLHPTVALRWTTLILGAGALWLCWPLWPALVLAAWTASLLRPLELRLQRRLGGRRAPAAILTSVVALALATPVVLLGTAVVVGARDLVATIAASPTASGALEEIASGEGGEAFALPQTLGDVVTLARSYGSQAFTLLSNVAGAAARAMLMLVVYFVATFEFMREGPTHWQWLATHLPLRRDHLERFAAAFDETGRGLLIGVGLTCLAQGVVATIALFALGVPQALVLGPLTGIASVIPAIGSALIWLPVAVGLLLTDHPIKAAILAVIGLGIIGTIDNFLRPVFSRFGALHMSTLVLFVSAFGGVMVMGAWGALLGPLSVRLLIEALVLARADDGGLPPERPRP